MDSEIGFEISLIVVEAIRGRCAIFMILTATVSEIFGGQANSSILESRPIDYNHGRSSVELFPKTSLRFSDNRYQ